MDVAVGTPEEGAVYNIGTAARKSGLSVTTIRTWEDRYGAVVPVRDGSGRRLYSAEQIAQLTWLRQQIDAGLRASEAHRLLISGETGEPRASVVVDQGSPWATMLVWAEQEKAWIGSILADLRRGLGAETTAVAAVVANPILGPVLSMTALESDVADQDLDQNLALIVVRQVDGLEDDLERGEPSVRPGADFGDGVAGVALAPIRLGGVLAGALMGVGAGPDEPEMVMRRAVRVVESRIEADRARSAFSNLLD